MLIHSPIIGHFSGTSGQLIAQTYNGKTYIRKKPNVYHYPGTEEQQKVQAIFWNIQHPWQNIYLVLSPFIPKWQRKNLNAFDTISAGIYKAIEAYPGKTTPRPLQFFGVDKYKHTKINALNKVIEVNDKTIIAKATIRIQTDFKRDRPTHYHILLLNVSRQELIYTFDNFTTNTITAEFSNINKWQPTHNIKLYIALSSPTFMSNFFLM